jgi:hypothetical protein
LTSTAAETKRFLAGLEQQAHAGDRLADLRSQPAAQLAGRLSLGAHGPPHGPLHAAPSQRRRRDLGERRPDGARVRNQVLNEPQIKRIRDAIEDLIVGPGVMTFADPFDPLVDLSACCPGTRSTLLRYALEADELFEEWFCDPKQFDLAGKRSGPEVQRMLVGENVERGGCLLVRVASNKPGRILPLCYQIVEYDQLIATLRSAAGGSGSSTKSSTASSSTIAGSRSRLSHLRRAPVRRFRRRRRSARARALAPSA